MGSQLCLLPPLAPHPQEAVRKYFNTAGFERWNKIYGETDEVNKVQLDIRKGHAATVENVLQWMDEEGSLEGKTVADCGKSSSRESSVRSAG